MNTHLLLILPIRALIRAFLCFAVTAAFAASANGQVYLSFSGGSGSPISMTLAAPIHYTINVAPETSAPLFLFQDVGSMFYWPGGGEVLLTGNLRYSVNGVGDYPMTNISSGVVGGDVGFLDTFLGGAGRGDVGSAGRCNYPFQRDDHHESFVCGGSSRESFLSNLPCGWLCESRVGLHDSRAFHLRPLRRPHLY